MKRNKTKVILAVALVLVLFGGWFCVHGINKTIEQTISVDVYEDSDWTSVTSSIKISGNLRKTLFSTNFVGTFAIENYEPSCRDGVEAKIEWNNNDYQSIIFYYAGDSSLLDIKMIDIDEEMDTMMIVFNDGTIIKTQDYYIPTSVWNNIKTE